MVTLVVFSHLALHLLPDVGLTCLGGMLVLRNVGDQAGGVFPSGIAPITECGPYLGGTMAYATMAYGGGGDTMRWCWWCQAARWHMVPWHTVVVVVPWHTIPQGLPA